MRAKSEWTPGGITLWLIAAILATLIVCSNANRSEDAAPSIDEVDVEVQTAQ